MSATRNVVVVAGIAALLVLVLYGTRHLAHDRSQSAIAARPALLVTARTEVPDSRKTPVRSSDLKSGAFIEICGMGTVRVHEDDPSGWQLVGMLAKGAEAQWIAALQASNDLHARAAGFMLAGAPRTEALAQLALQNADPALYDLALGACAKTEHPSAACAQISPDVWAQLDPDNAVAWLRVAWSARLRGDAAGETTAMRLAARAHRIDDYNHSLLAYSQPTLPANIGAAERNYFAIEAIGVEAGSGATQWSQASKYCSRQGVNIGTAEECRGLAELFESRGNTLMDLALAKSIGAYVGWSNQRLEAAQNYYEALMAEGESVEPVGDAARWSCDAQLAFGEYLRDLRQQGELKTLTDRYERSGVSTPELAQQHRDYIDALMKAAQADAEPTVVR